MNTVSHSTFESSDGLHKCYYVTVKPEGELRGIVQISHGMCEHIDRYLDFMNYLADNGFVVCGNDHLGHGKTADSPEELGYFSPEKGWQKAVADLHRMTKIIKSDYPGLPLFMVGHSMGSFFARAYAIKFGHECSAFVFMGTADGFETTIEATVEGVGGKIGEKLTGKLVGREGSLGSAALTFLLTQAEAIKKLKGEKYRSEMLDKISFGRTLERIENPRTKYDWLTRDESAVEKYSADPLCTYIFTVNGFINLASVLWYVSNDKWYMNMPKDIPLLLLSGDGDPIGNYGLGVRSVYNRLCAFRCDASLKIYEGARHELINETNQSEVYSDVLSFIEANLDKS